MKATNLEMEIIKRAINRIDIPKGCKAKLFYFNDNFDVTFTLGKSKLTFYSENGKLTYKVFVFELPRTSFMSVNEVKDIDFAFGQLLYFKGEIEK